MKPKKMIDSGVMTNINFYDRGFSRLPVEICFSISLQEKVKVRFSHKKDFILFPGQVYYMMVLDTCRASTSMIIDGAKNIFYSMSLKYFPGEFFPTLATTALK